MHEANVMARSRIRASRPLGAVTCLDHICIAHVLLSSICVVPESVNSGLCYKNQPSPDHVSFVMEGFCLESAGPE